MRHLGFLAFLGLGCVWFPLSAQEPGVPKEIQDAVKALKDPDAKVRAKAAWILGDQSKDAVSVLDELMAAFADPKLGVRASLADAFGQMGPKAKKAVPTLLTGLKDEDPHVRRRVVNALGMIKSEPKMVVPALIESLKDPDSGKGDNITYVPKMAAFALGNFGMDAKPAVPVLLKILDNPEIDWRFAVISPLSKIGDPVAVPHLVKYMDEKQDIYLRGHLADALARFGPNAKQAIPQIIAILNTQGSDQKTRSAKNCAVAALGKMGSEATPETIKVLVEVMKDKKLNPALRQQATRSLGNLGPKVAKDAIPAMVEVLQDRNLEAHGAVQQGLIAMGKAVVPYLIPLATPHNAGKINSYGVRGSVLRIFERLGPEAKDAIGVLTGVAAENDPLISPLAQRALDNIIGLKEPEKK